MGHTRTHHLRTLTAALDLLRATASRSDPLDEAVLCLVEAAVAAVTAAERARVDSCPEAALRDVLGAARAAVGAATFAIVAERDHGAADRRVRRARAHDNGHTRRVDGAHELVPRGS
ncbi:hypothetical protein [Actinokineospora sp.]|uniref:hypothetical protein n=1 Tax=Actinokineospora sp. TaxID=1872133 RepID=UPI0040382F83